MRSSIVSEDTYRAVGAAPYYSEDFPNYMMETNSQIASQFEQLKEFLE